LIRLALIIALLASPGAAWPFDNFAAVPGGIVGVPIADAFDVPPRAFFGSREVPVVNAPAGWIALVGLPRDLAPGFYVVTSADEEDHYESHRFLVKPVNRPIQEIEVPNTPDIAELVARHQSALDDPPVRAPEDAVDRPNLDFVLPVDLPIRFQFGFLRLAGTGHTLPFPGLGFDTERQSAVVSPASGQVFEVEETERAMRVVIHHGQGVISVFRNLESVSVTPEEWISKGDQIGILPGRNRLHLLPDWTVLLNGARVDPLLLVSQRIKLEAAPVDTLAPN
jgi:murein DD-endopeptidase MepM/ murein hydrolase activator NlpD